MVNINTSGAQSGRDFTYGASPAYPTTFIELYNEIMIKFEQLSLLNDEETIKREINKIRKKAQKLINDHFTPSISQLKSNKAFKVVADSEEKNLNKIIKELTLQ